MVRMTSGMVELRVQNEGDEILVYAFRTLAEAAEMLDFLKDFFPAARFVVQPVRH